ncbi:MAG: lipopolysaccharide biosynthesis protein [Pontixanthobacter sp.]
MSADQPKDANDGPIRRILGNVGWLLGGKGFGAVSSLLYLAILSRSLGVKDFGHFALIFGISQAVCSLASFQTWQVIVRFGAPHLAGRDDAAFGRLAVLGGLVDGAGALIGCVATILFMLSFGDLLEINPAYFDVALVFICAMLWARVSAPYGIIRALDRFELSVFIGAITPAGRLIAATIIWLTGPTVVRFLIAWAAVEFVTAAAMWFASWRLRPDLLKFSNLRDWRQTLSENKNLPSFLGVTYCTTSVYALLQQGPLLAVGYLFGTSAAGVYRIADQLAKGLGKFALVLSDAVYPEVNRQIHERPADQFIKLVRHVSFFVVLVSVIVVGLAALIGDDVLLLIAGDQFSAGEILIVPLVLAASFELASVSYESVLHSVGRPQYHLFARLGSLIFLIIAIFVVDSNAALGVAWSVAAAQAFEYVVMTVIISLVLRSLAKRGGNKV